MMSSSCSTQGYIANANGISNAMLNMNDVDDKCTIYVGNIAFEAPDQKFVEDVRAVMKPYLRDTTFKVKLMKKGLSRYAFVMFQTPEIADSAKRVLNGFSILGKTLRVGSKVRCADAAPQSQQSQHHHHQQQQLPHPHPQQQQQQQPQPQYQQYPPNMNRMYYNNTGIPYYYHLHQQMYQVPVPQQPPPQQQIYQIQGPLQPQPQPQQQQQQQQQLPPPPPPPQPIQLQPQSQQFPPQTQQLQPPPPPPPPPIQLPPQTQQLQPPPPQPSLPPQPPAATTSDNQRQHTLAPTMVSTGNMTAGALGTSATVTNAVPALDGEIRRAPSPTVPTMQAEKERLKRDAAAITPQLEHDEADHATTAGKNTDDDDDDEVDPELFRKPLKRELYNVPLVMQEYTLESLRALIENIRSLVEKDQNMVKCLFTANPQLAYAVLYGLNLVGDLSAAEMEAMICQDSAIALSEIVPPPPTSIPPPPKIREGEQWKRQFTEFLEHNLSSETIMQMRSQKNRRYIVDLDQLRITHRNLVTALLERAIDVIPALTAALNDRVTYVITEETAAAAAASGAGGNGGNDDGNDEEDPKEKLKRQQMQMEEQEEEEIEREEERNHHWTLGFTGSFGANNVNPRTLRSSNLWGLICVEGMITKCSTVHPMLVKSVHYCNKTHSTTEKTYNNTNSTQNKDVSKYSFSTISSSTAYYPIRDHDGNPLITEYGQSIYKDHQTAVIQEMPEHAPAGQLPRSVNVVFEDDLVDRVKPGDRVQIMGVYMATISDPVQLSTFRTVLVANNIRQVLQDSSLQTFTDGDIKNIRAVGRTPDVYDRMSASLAPSIYGHSAVKRAMLLQLMGGQEKVTSGGIHLRGDIHLLLVGDPSTAKSQLLRYMLNVAPLAVSTNARGASGVGLTAAVVPDPETRERSLEAGAMVLADRGVVCIDEFDKMDTTDRAALHEVMEQQTVTIQKAGVHASLNARCSVFAAANPIYGTYNREKSVSQNIGFPSTLLSRFDSLFVILDPADPHRDRAIASHVLKMHREGNHVPLADAAGAVSSATGDNESTVSLEDTLSSGSRRGGQMAASAAAGMDETTPVYTTNVARDDNSINGMANSFDLGADDDDDDDDNSEKNKDNRLFTLGFIRKYVTYARHRIFPQMTHEAGEVLKDSFAEFRQRELASHRSYRSMASASTGGGGGGGGRGQIRYSQATLPITARLLESLVRLSEAHARCRLSKEVTVEDAQAAVALLKYSLYGEGTGAPEPIAMGLATKDDANNTKKEEEEEETVYEPVNKKQKPEEVYEVLYPRILDLLKDYSDGLGLSIGTIEQKLDGKYDTETITEVLNKMNDGGLVVFDPSENTVYSMF